MGERVFRSDGGAFDVDEAIGSTQERSIDLSDGINGNDQKLFYAVEGIEWRVGLSVSRGGERSDVKEVSGLYACPVSEKNIRAATQKSL